MHYYKCYSYQFNQLLNSTEVQLYNRSKQGALILMMFNFTN
jgi:hypothetical protein